jgi:hypothetical protein
LTRRRKVLHPRRREPEADAPDAAIPLEET